MKTKVILKVFLAFCLLNLFIGCALDSYIFKITNNSDYPIYVNALGIYDFGKINSKETIEKRINYKTSDFNLLITINSKNNTFRFYDVDHWFGVIHKITINVSNENIFLNSSGSARFVEEIND